jgi:hypothetical protein
MFMSIFNPGAAPTNPSPLAAVFRVLDLGECKIAWLLKNSMFMSTARFWGMVNGQSLPTNRL